MPQHIDRDRIGNALQMLFEEGLKCYKPEYQDGMNRWRAIGKAIAENTDRARDYLNLAYEALEQWNYHSHCFVLDWIANLYEGHPHERDLQRLAKMINKRNVTVLTEWNTGRADYDKKRVNVRVVIEEVIEAE